MSYLLVVPDLPRTDGQKQADPFLLSTLKSALAGIRVLAKDDQWGLSQVYLKTLHLLSTAAWSAYPYHIGKFEFLISLCSCQCLLRRVHNAKSQPKS